jgi:hypothetical protein
MPRILAAGDVAAICTEAQFTDSRPRVLGGTPARRTGFVAHQILLFDDNSSKLGRVHDDMERP